MDQYANVQVSYVMKRRRSGFTIVELSIVIMLMAIMTAAAAPKYYDTSSYFALETAATRITADLKWAQRQAKLKSTSCKVDFDEVDHKYVMNGVQSLVNGGADNLVALKNLYGVEIDKAEFTSRGSTVPSITFGPYGLPDRSGLITLKRGAQTLDVVVVWATGRIYIRRS